MRKGYAVLANVAALLLISMLSGCGQAGSGSEVGSERNDVIKLKIMHNWTGEDGKAIAMREIMEQFRISNPHIELQDEGLPTDVMKVRMRTVAAADEMPDLFVIWPEAMTRDYVTGGLIQPIGDFLDSRPGWRDEFMPGAFEPFTVNDEIYTVPMNLAPTSILYYNQLLFDRYEVKVPETWDELTKAIQKFNEKSIIPIALGNKANWVVQSTLFSTLADRVTGTEWFENAVNGKEGARFTDQQFVDALKLLQELGKAGAFQSSFHLLDDNQMMQLYFDEQAAMFINGAWATSNIVQNAPKHVLDHTHITILPPIEGGKGEARSISGVVGTGLGVSSKLKGERKEAALDLLYALAGPDGQKATLDSSTLLYYKLEPDPNIAHPLFIELYELMQNVAISPVYDVSLGLQAVGVINSGLQDILLGGNPYRLAQQLHEAHAASVRN